MKVYFDTNVLVAALQPDHIHHTPSFAALSRIRARSMTGYMAGHGLAELYSVLTRTPFVKRIFPDEAQIMIEQTIVSHFHIIEVTTQSHLAAIALCAKAGWRGDRIHDAVHIQAAAQAGCDLIYTYNLADFHVLAPIQTSQILSPPPPESR
jgi:predicted nucleic acid-binding protein